MSLGKFASLYGVCTAVFFVLDFIWLITATPRIYAPKLGDLLAEQPRLGVAAVFYLVYLVGLESGSLSGALWRGALFGFIAYATYDLTNLATIRNWPVDVTIIDLVWGTSLNTVIAAAGYLAGTRWFGLGG
jgi:uncharacterized membrane protein